MKKYLKFVLLLGLSIVFLSGCLNDLVTPTNELNQSENESGSTVVNQSGDSGAAGSNNSETETGGASVGKGTLEIYLTDAPGDYQEVNIELSKIEGHIAVEGEEGYWVSLTEWPTGYPLNLLELEGSSLLLASLELEPHQYTQLRLFLNTEASLVVAGEEGPLTVPLEIPSSLSSGIKLNHPFEIVEGMITKLTIDFDAQKSVIQTGNGGYKMKPVISLSSETYSSGEVLEGVGKVFGSVTLYDSASLSLVGIAEAEVELTGGVYYFTNKTVTLADGSFILLEVPAGNYTLTVYTEGYGNYQENIEVIADSGTVINVVFLTEEPGGISGGVLDSISGEYISGAEVIATLSGGSNYSFESSTETDQEGDFLITNLPVGSYHLTISADGYAPYETDSGEEVQVSPGEIIDIGDIGLTKIP